MKLPVKLQDLLQQNEQAICASQQRSAIAATSTLIGQGMVDLDCTTVESLTPEQLTLLFSGIPDNWDFNKLREVLDENTLTKSFKTQLKQWLNQRLGIESVEPEPLTLNSQSPIPSPQSLDIFNLRDEVIDDYRRYIESFLKIRDPRVQAFVDQELERGELWPDPLVQLNPAYKAGSSVTELVQQGILHPDCTRYFSKDGKPFRFHYHQEQAFRRAQHQEPYVLTTGTGSGKSMTYAYFSRDVENLSENLSPTLERGFDFSPFPSREGG